MSGFIQRYNVYPGTETITKIEGVSIIDLPPPGSIEGIDTGVVCLVGEFPDMAYATDVDSSGGVSTHTQPQEVLSTQDMLNKFGGFDPTIGDFGRSNGNGFAAIANKRYSRLLIAPVNLASNVGARFFRQLPMCSSQSDTLPAVPIAGGQVLAGREFNNVGGGRVLVGKRIGFTALDAIAAGLHGETIAGASAATQVFTSSAVALKVWQVVAPATFTDMTTQFNDATAANFLPFNAVETVGDYVAFGMDATFEKLTMFNTGGTQGTVGVVAWEYWNGSAWTALTVVDGTNGFKAAVSATAQIVTWTAPSDWASNALNSVTAYYVRARVTTVYTVNPAYSQGFVGGLDWSTIVRPDGDLGAKEGDIFVLGYDNLGAIAPAAEGGTYRVVSDPPAGVDITLERLDGANFTWTAQTDIPWRLHVSSDADSAPVFVVGALGAGGYSAADAGGYSTPVRPITNATGGTTDGSYTIGELINPSVNPPALTGDTADPLSGLGGRLHVVTAMTFVAATQGLNAPSSAFNDALYVTAMDATISDLSPISAINIIFAARTSANIRAGLKQNVLTASADGLGRVCVASPELTVQSTAVAVGDASPGVGSVRNERVIYSWPGAKTYLPEAVGIRLRVADGLTVIDGTLDMPFDGWIASLMSNMPPELNIGQSAAPVPAILAGVLGVQRGVPRLDKRDYVAMLDRRVCGLRMDRTVGPVVQSGVTTSLIAGQKNIARRRMADFIQDSLAGRMNAFCKLLQTQSNKDSALAECDAFMQDLLSVNNPAAQRIAAYSLDAVSGNTEQLEALGVFVIIVRVKTLSDMAFIVLQTEIGEAVRITQLAA